MHRRKAEFATSDSDSYGSSDRRLAVVERCLDDLDPLAGPGHAALKTQGLDWHRAQQLDRYTDQGHVPVSRGPLDFTGKQRCGSPTVLGIG